MNLKNLSIFIIFVFCTNLQAEDLTDIQIIAPTTSNADVQNEAIQDIKTKNTIDGGDLLQSINGINSIRKGGHGLDPVIRGQSDQRLNTFIDGAMIYGGCSTKMDVASTYANIESYDTITVIKGTQSVIYGAGGPGGVVSYNRVTEPFGGSPAIKGQSQTMSPFKIKLGQTFDSNAETKTSIADITYSTGKSYLRYNLGYTDSGNYETGTGLKPKTEYRTSNNSLTYGSRLSDGSKLEFSYTDNQQENVGYPGLKMDITHSHADIYNVKYHRVTPIGMFTSMKVELFNSDMDHLMDNYTMRATNTMKTPASSDTFGWRIIGAINDSVRMGIDYEDNSRDAEQNMVISGTNRHLAYSWPGAEISKLGFFYETDMKLSNDKIFSYGLRWDKVDTDAIRAALDPGAAHMAQVTANSLYTAHYTGTVTASKRDFNNYSGFLRFKKFFSINHF